MRLLKTLICLGLFVAFIGCAGHCFVEKAFAVSQHSSHHCAHHGKDDKASDREDHHHSQSDHHHESPCASTLSLLNKATFFASFLTAPTPHLSFQPDFAVATTTKSMQVKLDSKEISSCQQLLYGLSLAPNAPPASF